MSDSEKLYGHKTCNQDMFGSFTLQSCKTTAKKCTKQVCYTCKVAFLLIRPIVVFSPFSFPSPLSTARLYRAIRTSETFRLNARTQGRIQEFF